MKVALSKVTNFKNAYPFRGRLAKDPQGEYQVIQTSDISETGQVVLDSCIKVSGITPKEKYLLSKGDVLFIGKGYRNQAGCISVDVKNTVAAVTLHVFQAKPEIFPEYLAWFLNQPPAQRWIKSRNEGSVHPNLSLKTLGELPVTVPDLPTQQKILAIHKLALKEQDLMKQYLFNRKAMIDHSLLKLISDHT